MVTNCTPHSTTKLRFQGCMTVASPSGPKGAGRLPGVSERGYAREYVSATGLSTIRIGEQQFQIKPQAWPSPGGDRRTPRAPLDDEAAPADAASLSAFSTRCPYQGK